MSKALIEHFVHLQLYGHLTKSNLALNNVALLLTTLCQFTDDLFNSMDQGTFTGGRLFGLEEGIGTQDTGMSGISLSWFQSYLAGRKHTYS